MNKVIAKLANILAANGKGQEAVFQALKAVAYDVCENKDGTVKADVITDYAYDVVKSHMNNHQFAGYLSALKANGQYKPRDEGFGTVILGKQEQE